MPARVLIVDDDRNLRQMLSTLLAHEGHVVRSAEDAAGALTASEAFDPDVVLLDLVMPRGPDGLTALEHLRADHPDTVVIMMSGKATLSDAVRATKLGAFQFLEKPLSPEAVVSSVGAAVTLVAARRENRALRTQLPDADSLVGSSAAMDEVRSLIARVAGTSSRVLITGESGTGKELVARAIHARSPRAGRPFVAVNCAAVPRELIESEMFGHEKGAFTGAYQRRHGRFELADGGTLFLDEVGDLDLAAQAKLLRVLETGTVERVGSERQHQVDVRVLAATNKHLAEEITANRFRADLYYRLNVYPIPVPPLRGRRQDIPHLVTHLAHRIAARSGRAARPFTPKAMAQLQQHEWPGNVRELANVVERLLIVGDETPVTEKDIHRVFGAPRALRPSSPPAPGDEGGLTATLERYEREIIEAALASANGNVAEAARQLKTDRANLYRRLRRLGIQRPDSTGHR